MSSLFSAIQSISKSFDVNQENKAMVKQNNTDIQTALSGVLNLELLQQNMDASLNQYFTMLNTFVNDTTNSVNPALDYIMYAVKSDDTLMSKGVSDTKWSSIPGFSSIKNLTSNSDGSYYSVTGSGDVYSMNKIESGSSVKAFSKTGLTKAMKMPNGTILAVISGSLSYKTSATDLTWLPIANPTSSNPSSVLYDFCLSTDQQTLLGCFATGIYKIQDYTLLETGWIPTNDPTSALRSISVAPDGTTYGVKVEDGKMYQVDDVLTLQGTGSGQGWSLIPVPLSGVAFVTIGYNGAMQLRNKYELDNIRNTNDSLQAQIEAIKAQIDAEQLDQTNIYADKNATITRLNATFEQLRRDREQIQTLLDDYYTSDRQQQDAGLYAESSNMRFKIFFVVFFVIVVFMIRSMMRKGNPFIGLANPMSERMLYLGIVVAMLFALNMFQSTFGFVLFAGLLLLAVLMVSGSGQGQPRMNSYITPMPGSMVPGSMVPGSMVPSSMMGPPSMPLLSPVGSPFSR